MLKHRRKELPRFVTAQTELFPHGLQDFCNEQIAALKRLVTYWGFCGYRAKFKVAGHLGCLRTSAPEKGE
jgi:hypothetical protein